MTLNVVRFGLGLGRRWDSMLPIVFALLLNGKGQKLHREVVKGKLTKILVFQPRFISAIAFLLGSQL